MYGFEILWMYWNYICYLFLNNIFFYVVKEFRFMFVKYIELILFKILIENLGKKFSLL